MRFASASFLVGVLGIVLDEKGRVLLFEHTYRPFAPREETGLTIEVFYVLEVRSGARPQRLDIWLRCRSRGGSAAPSVEVDEARFCELDSLPPLIGEQERFLREHRSQFAS